MGAVKLEIIFGVKVKFILKGSSIVQSERIHYFYICIPIPNQVQSPAPAVSLGHAGSDLLVTQVTLLCDLRLMYGNSLGQQETNIAF